MERSEWLKEIRRSTEERYDRLFATIYDKDWGASIAPTHEQFLNRFLGVVPAHSLILDAACGTGKYWDLILERGMTVHGIDQSQGMLARAKDKHPEVSVEKLGLQEIHYEDVFDGAICMDAMEFIFPEDWLLILNNFHRALKSPGHLYFTVELADSHEIDNAYQAGREMGLPIVLGEWAHEDGYHYYPRVEQVREWLHESHFSMIDEAEGDEYHHFWVKKAMS